MRLFTWIALIFKLIVVIVFWKDSLDFRNIIRQKKESPDDELNDILAQYEAWREDKNDFKDSQITYWELLVDKIKNKNML